MTPKHLPLFYWGLIIGLAGAWLFAFTTYWIAVEPLDPNYCCGANIGAGLAGMFSWLLGLIAAALIVLSFVIKPSKSK